MLHLYTEQYNGLLFRQTHIAPPPLSPLRALACKASRCTALYVSEASYILLMQLAPYLAHRETIQLTSDKICDSSFRLTMVWWLSFGLGSNNEFSSYIKRRPSLEPRWNDPEKSQITLILIFSITTRQSWRALHACYQYQYCYQYNLYFKIIIFIQGVQKCIDHLRNAGRTSYNEQKIIYHFIKFAIIL